MCPPPHHTYIYTCIHTSTHPHIQIIECREYLKQYWDDGALGDFIEETIDKTNSRLYGTHATPAAGADAMDYLDRASYSDDDWVAGDEEEEEEEAAKGNMASQVKAEEGATAAPTAAAPATAPATVASGLIILTDSEDSDEEDEDDEDEENAEDNSFPSPTNAAAAPSAAPTAAPTAANVPAAQAPAPAAAAVVTPQESAARLKLAKLERQRAAAAERERIELEQRKQRFLAAAQAPKNARTALLTALRQKVHQTAKENYCVQKKISSEQLGLKLKIAEKCR